MHRFTPNAVCMATTKEVTIYDIAKALEISPSTVSRALSSRTSLVHKETVARIREKARELGYRQNLFASRLRSQRTYMIAAVVSRLNTKSIADIVSGAEIKARQAGYSLGIYQSMDCWDQYTSIIDTLHAARLEGVLLTRSTFPHDETINVLQKGIPHVITEAAYVPSDASTSTDAFDITYAVTMDLVNKACKRILFVYTNPKISYNTMLNGYRKALADSKVSREFICCGFNLEEKQFWNNTIASASPDGIILASDLVASFSIHDHSIGQQHNHLARTKGERCGSIIENNIWNSILFNEHSMVETGRVATSMLIALIENKHEQQESLFK